MITYTYIHTHTHTHIHIHTHGGGWMIKIFGRFTLLCVAILMGSVAYVSS